MRIYTSDGMLIEINYIDAQIKMACAAEDSGNDEKLELHLNLAQDATDRLASSVELDLDIG